MSKEQFLFFSSVIKKPNKTRALRYKTEKKNTISVKETKIKALTTKNNLIMRIPLKLIWQICNFSHIKFEAIGGWCVTEPKIKPGIGEFFCQKLSHQSDSVALGSIGTTLMLLHFFDFFDSRLAFLDFLGGAIEQRRDFPLFGLGENFAQMPAARIWSNESWSSFRREMFVSREKYSEI